MQHFFLSCPTGWHLMTLSLTSLTSSCVVSSTHPTWVSIRPGRRPWCGAPGAAMMNRFSTEPGAAPTTETPSSRTHRCYFVSFLQFSQTEYILNNPVYFFSLLFAVVCVWREETRGWGTDLSAAERPESHTERGTRRKPGYWFRHTQGQLSVCVCVCIIVTYWGPLPV